MKDKKTNWVLIAVLIIGLVIVLYLLFRPKSKTSASPYENFMGDNGYAHIFETEMAEEEETYYEKMLIYLGAQEFSRTLYVDGETEASPNLCTDNDYVHLVFENPTSQPISTVMFGQVSETPLNQIGKQLDIPPTVSNYGLSNQDNTLFLTNRTTGELYIVDTTTNTLIKTTVLGGQPLNPCPGGSQLFIPDFTTNIVNVVDILPSSGTYGEIIATITLGVNERPARATFLNGFVYVSYFGTGATPSGVSIYSANGPGYALVNQYALSGPLSDIDDIIIAASKIYISDASNDQLYVIDVDPTSPTYNTLLTLILTSPTPRGSDTNDDNSLVYVGTSVSVDVIDTATDTVIASIPVGAAANDITYNNDNVFASINSLNQIEVFNAASFDAVTIINLGPSAPGYLLSTQFYIYVSDGTPNGILNIIDDNPASETYLEIVNSLVLGSAFNFTVNIIPLVAENAILSVPTHAGIVFQVPVPLVSLNMLAKYSMVDTQPIEVCSVKYICKTEEQLKNLLSFVNKQITGIDQKYDVVPIDYKTSATVQNIVYIRDFPDGLILYSNQSIIHTINPKEVVEIYVFYKQVVDRAGGMTAKAQDSLPDELDGETLEDQEFEEVIIELREDQILMIDEENENGPVKLIEETI